MPDPSDQPAAGPDPFAAARRAAHPDTEHSVRIEADPSGGDVVLQLDCQWLAGSKLCGWKQDVGIFPVGAVRVDRERDAAGRVVRVRVSLELTRLPDLPG